MRGPVALQKHRLSSPALEGLSRAFQSSQVLGIPALRSAAGGVAGGVCLFSPKHRGWFALGQPLEIVPVRSMA
eukprot:11205507-Lingulodinium_polyedra.AAC.1